MRQAGIIAAGGLYALKNNVNRLKIDHEHARTLANTLNNCSWIHEVMDVHTNIVVAQVSHEKTVMEAVEAMAKKDVHVMPFGPDTLRIVTHLDNSPQQIKYAKEVIENI
jgi:threonine aldolase